MSITTNDDTSAKELQQLYYDARRHYRIGKQPITLDSVAVRGFHSCAASHNIAGAQALIRASELEGQGAYQDALILLKEEQQTFSPILLGLAWHLRGILNHALARKAPAHYTQAIACYKTSNRREW